MSSPANDPSRRRAALGLAANPRSQIDYVVTVDFAAPLRSGAAGRASLGQVLLRYVPDREVLEAGSVAGYLDALAAQDWSGPEAVAAAMFDDFNNQLVPRWLHLVVIDANVRVDLHDRQPQWDNPGLLATLPPI